MIGKVSRFVSQLVVLLTLSACASTAPLSALPVTPANAISPGDAVYLRLYRTGFDALTCPYDDNQISCGAYLLNRFGAIMRNNTQIEELAISNFSFLCERVGSVVTRQNCTVKYRLDYRLGGETLQANITANKEKAPMPALGDKSKSIFKFLSALLDQSVAEFETSLAQ